MYDCILFDFDGTLFDTVEGITRSVRYALNKAGIDAEPETLLHYYHDPLFAKMGEVRTIIDKLETLTASEYWPYPTYYDLLFSV